MGANAASDDDEECGEEVETKVSKHLEVETKIFKDGMKDFLLKHDSDKDGVVSEMELKSAFKEAGVSDKCLSQASASLKHLTTHRDHNDDGKLHHHELEK